MKQDRFSVHENFIRSRTQHINSCVCSRRQINLAGSVKNSVGREIFRQSNHAVAEPEALGANLVRTISRRNSRSAVPSFCSGRVRFGWILLAKKTACLRKPVAFKINVVVMPEWANNLPTGKQSAGISGCV